jgi:cysteine desulfurase/selenocysteine lyase
VKDVRTARDEYPATGSLAYFNTAAVGLASRRLAAVYHATVDAWTVQGFDFTVGEAAAERARAAVARLMGADPADVALIASVSTAAGMVAAQFGPATSGENVVIGEREYSSNHFPWRMLAERGYDVRQVPFRDGGIQPDDVATRVDGGTVVVACSAVQTATGHRTDLAALGTITGRVGAVLFVDGAQLVGALPVTDLGVIDVLATSDHKFLLNAGRGVGYCYLSKRVQERFRPVSPGWKAGREPLASFFGPEMDLSPTASRFDNSISWLAALGDDAAIAPFAEFGADAVFARNREVTALLRTAVTEVGWVPVALVEANQSTIVSVALAGRDPAGVLAALRAGSVVAAARDGHLRLSVHLYNDERDVEHVARVLASL